MDIRKWLEETALPEQPPSLPEQLGLPPFLHPKEPQQTARAQRRRKRSTSDSSLLEARPRRRETPPVVHTADIDSGSDESACSEGSHSADQSSGSSAASQRYARRSRRKTRLEHYEPAAKHVRERGKQGNRHRAAESKRTRRKARRNKTDRQGVGLVQSFHAKNVPKDRLTLKPREKLGIFSKGKASSPVKGRGLPDLVFSEMKFLQKNRGQPEAVPQPGIPKKKRKKDHAQARQEEISAYFNSPVRPALAEKDVNTQAKGGTRRRILGRNVEQEREESATIDNAIHTVETADKGSYLGSGSRGPRHQSGSYISWSESVLAPSATPIRLRAGSAVQVGQLGSINKTVEGVGIGGGNAPLLRTRPSPTPRHVTEDSRERFQIYTVAPANLRASRSQSFLPQSSPRRGSLAKKPAASHFTASPSALPVTTTVPTQVPAQETRKGSQHEHIDNSEHSSTPQSKPAQDPKLFQDRQRQEMDAAEAITDNHDYPELFRHGQRGQILNSAEILANNDDQEPSSGLGNLLQCCRSAFEDGQVETGEVDNFVMDPPGLPNRGRIEGYYHGPPQRLPTVRFAGPEICPPPVPSLSAPGIYEEQERRERAMENEHHALYEVAYDPYLPDEDLMEEEEGVSYDDFEWEALPAGSGAPACIGGALEEDFLELEELQHGNQDIPQGNSFGNGGFWRPHKLY
ncbi:hypothetical protein P154DRAFT_619550 [Amniculicola lignicola CBS 123094]|uniref:Uncharacterized protein n=1 Tax=Amniculicola lignicola CBS 123094 TaxID=1392246 RepID=A0A6A5WQ43_9PLEO|nr:hypothetical protein P154DRAFT_619550 [Amniculicola lignicola CBS 123094]